eukprot:8654863-Pyramimonas_sp.AAC.1
MRQTVGHEHANATDTTDDQEQEGNVSAKIALGPRAAAPGRSTSGCRRRVEAHHRAVDIETMLKDTSP